MQITNKRLPVILNDALDEIFWLRAGFAYEALVTANHLTYRSFPTPRRYHIINQVHRMILVAGGQVEQTYGDTSNASLDEAMLEAGVDQTLSMDVWIDTRIRSNAKLLLRNVDEAEAAILRTDLDRAVLEIFQLRQAAAYEAKILGIHVYGQSFPKAPERTINEQTARLVVAASGRFCDVYRTPEAVRALRAVGVSQDLTNEEWRAEKAVAPQRFTDQQARDARESAAR